MRPRPVLIVLVVVTAVALCLPVAHTSARAGGLDGLTGSAGCPPLDEVIDGVPAVANPFDPALIDVGVTFTGPDGTAREVSAFFLQDFERSLDAGGAEVRSPLGAPTWRVRFSPPVPGAWTWRPVVHVPGAAPLDLGARSFVCASDPTGHGVLRRSTADTHRLAYADGTPFVAIGENLAWYGPGGTYDYDRWIGALASHGATWIRVWMPSWSMGLEWLRRDAAGTIIESSLGNYTTRLDRAWQLDHVIDAARRHGIVVQLVLSNPEWGDNPYNAANGGPLAQPNDMFTDATARELFKRRLRYIVARWGYAPNLIWELWNEVDLSGAPADAIVGWHDEMAGYLGAIDPLDHLRTTSTYAFWDFGKQNPTYDRLWSSDQIDLVQLHVYGTGEQPVDFVSLLPRIVPRVESRYGKPVIIGEAGVDWRGPEQTNAADPSRQGLHELVWSGVFAGSVGTSMTWWWDSVIDASGAYDAFDGMTALVDGVAPSAPLTRTAVAAAAADGDALTAFALHADRSTVVWIRNPANWWHAPDTTTITGATLVGLDAGRWQLSWLDPRSGQTSDGGIVTIGGPSSTVSVPAFAGEIALRATALDVAPPPSTAAPPPTAAPPAPTTTVAVADANAATATARAVTAVPAFTG